MNEQEKAKLKSKYTDSARSKWPRSDRPETTADSITERFYQTLRQIDHTEDKSALHELVEDFFDDSMLDLALLSVRLRDAVNNKLHQHKAVKTKRRSYHRT